MAEPNCAPLLWICGASPGFASWAAYVCGANCAAAKCAGAGAKCAAGAAAKCAGAAANCGAAAKCAAGAAAKCAAGANCGANPWASAFGWAAMYWSARV